ncbi:anaerobic ribonucleoside-triphosphate reductase activating protein [Candidatus Falkowbacteria bacterium]|nr:anaerobic ribonucleoside-triphosphate reductase activating protein [Candidatus Falkowbacteria bacterium]
MLIGGLQKFSLLDYPEHLAAIIFTQGCNFRCRFCYNPMLVASTESGKFKKGHHLIHPSTKDFGERVKEGDLFDFLKSRLGKLEGVVITGGEPTLHSDLPEFIAKIKKMGFKVKLDTNGTNTEMLLLLLAKEGVGVRFGGEPALVDYIAMDIKAPLEKYEKVVGAAVDFTKIKQSIKIIMSSGLPYEFRTTVVPGLHSRADIVKMGELIKGAKKWYLQFFKSDIDLVDEKLKGKKAFSKKEMEEMAEVGRRYVKKCEIR